MLFIGKSIDQGQLRLLLLLAFVPEGCYEHEQVEQDKDVRGNCAGRTQECLIRITTFVVDPDAVAEDVSLAKQ